MDRTLSSGTTPRQSGPENNGNGVVLCIPQSSSIVGSSPSECLVSYLGHSLAAGFLLLCREAVGVFYSPSRLGKGTDDERGSGDSELCSRLDGDNIYPFAQLSGAVEYTDCFSEGVRPSHECPGHGTKLSNTVVPVTLGLWGMRSTSSLLLLRDQLWT